MRSQMHFIEQSHWKKHMPVNKHHGSLWNPQHMYILLTEQYNARTDTVLPWTQLHHDDIARNVTFRMVARDHYLSSELSVLMCCSEDRHLPQLSLQTALLQQDACVRLRLYVRPLSTYTTAVSDYSSFTTYWLHLFCPLFEVANETLTIDFSDSETGDSLHLLVWRRSSVLWVSLRTTRLSSWGLVWVCETRPEESLRGLIQGLDMSYYLKHESSSDWELLAQTLT